MKFVKCFLVILMLAGLGLYMCSNSKETGKNEAAVMI